eukprot:TRINITY_DN520_c0_g2_i1.p1 TRINITY_DN520_c0_g2~~TRINITY_DN520_c0_g2_i1.p1  ORF type:complete len:179 (+),score=39.43 TRINITY_DN520_c0_g2_i1:341-877(+)
MVYHSSFVDVGEGIPVACGCPLLPLRVASGDIPEEGTDPESFDIVDEAILYFRANVLFRTFEVKSPADKLLIYLTLYINIALKKVEACKSEGEGARLLVNLANESFPIPGEAGFPLGGLLSAPQTKEEGELFRNYIWQAREAVAARLPDQLYLPEGGPNKWWLAFAKRKFMNVSVRAL